MRMDANNHKHAVLDAFVAKSIKIEVMLERFGILSEDHFNRAPEAVDWSHADTQSRGARIARSILLWAHPANARRSNWSPYPETCLVTGQRNNGFSVLRRPETTETPQQCWPCDEPKTATIELCGVFSRYDAIFCLHDAGYGAGPRQPTEMSGGISAVPNNRLI